MTDSINGKSTPAVFITMSKLGVRYPVPRFIQGQRLQHVPNAGSGQIIKAGKQLYVDAITGIDLHIEAGTRLGIVGPNGAGKSTLLRVITGIFPPTSGEIRVGGNIGSMLDINTGFDQNETGFDNIFLRGIFMGFDPKTIAARVDEISELSGLGDYLNMPLFTYSSGMRARLSFAIATGFEVDLIVMDEWLSAGDASFREKAQAHMSNYVEQASILVIASHSTPLLQRVCNRLIVLNAGSIMFDGSSEDGLAFYGELMKKIAS